MTDTQAAKSLLVLNGHVPCFKALGLSLSVPIVACDGAEKRLKQQGVCPHFVIGDGDSSDSPCLIQDKDQETTDFEKGLFFLEKKQLFPTLILGINGGEIDHIYGNAQVMLRYAKSYPISALDTYQKEGVTKIKRIIPLTDTLVLTTSPQKTLSIIPADIAVISSKGLQWELKKTMLSLDEKLGLRNRTLGHTAFLKMHKGKALVVIDL